MFANLELSGGAEAGVAALEKRKRKPGPYRGLNRSEGHMAFVRQCRKMKMAQAGDSSKVMRNIWNGAKILRGGETGWSDDDANGRLLGRGMLVALARVGSTSGHSLVLSVQLGKT